MIPEDIRITYDDWNQKKQALQASQDTNTFHFNEGDVWWCSLGVNLGDESFGKGEKFRRPILIIKKLSLNLCIALPLTSKSKQGSWFIDITLRGEKRWVMLHQIRALHKKRFQHKMGELSLEDVHTL